MSYTDLTNSFAYKGPLPFNKMDALALNDSFDVFRSGTKKVFYQSALPAGWTKLTGFNDSALRVVAGASGGTNSGSTGLSSTLILNHNHNSPAHTHTGITHLHTFIMSGPTGNSYVVNTNKQLTRTSTTLKVNQADGIGSVNINTQQNQTVSTTPSLSSDSVGTLSSQLSNIAFAYCDMIMASKDA